MHGFRSESPFGHLIPRDSNVSPLLADSCCNVSPLIPPFYDPCAFNLPGNGKVWPPQAPKPSDRVAEPQTPIWLENESWIPETGSSEAKPTSPSKSIHKVDPKKKKKRKRRKPVQLEDAEFAWNMANVTKTSGMSPYVWFLMARRPELILAGVPQQDVVSVAGREWEWLKIQYGQGVQAWRVRFHSFCSVIVSYVECHPVPSDLCKRKQYKLEAAEALNSFAHDVQTEPLLQYLNAQFNL